MENSKTKAWCLYAAYGFFFLLLGLRSYSRLIFPQIVNEDTRIFLPEALQWGYKSLFHAYAGYFHTLPRLIALFAVQFDALLWPFLLTSSCVFIFAYACLRVSAKDFQESFGSRETRVFTSCTLVLMSGLKEGLGNPTNLHWILALFVVFLGFRNKKSPLPLHDLLLVSLAASSAGELIAFAPIFAFRIWRDRSKSDMWILGNIIFFAGLNVLFKESGPPIEWSSLTRIPTMLCYGTFNQILLIPLIGDELSYFLAKHFAGIYWILGLGALVFALKQILRYKMEIPTLAAASLLGFMLLAGLAREDLIHLFDKMVRPASHIDQRYAIIPSAVAILFWTTLLLRSGLRRSFGAFVIVYFLLRLSPLVIPAHEPLGKSWRERVEEARSNGAEKDWVKVQAWPSSQFLMIPNSKEF